MDSPTFKVFMSSPPGSPSSPETIFSAGDGSEQGSESPAFLEEFKRRMPEGMEEYLHELPQETDEERELTKLVFDAYIEKVMGWNKEEEATWLGRTSDWWYWFVVANLVMLCIHLFWWNLNNSSWELGGNPFWGFFL